jgi:hypothetical protein
MSLLFLCAACLGLTACSRPKSPGYQGYLEGEFVYVGAPLGGQLEKLAEGCLDQALEARMRVVRARLFGRCFPCTKCFLDTRCWTEF